MVEGTPKREESGSLEDKAVQLAWVWRRLRGLELCC